MKYTFLGTTLYCILILWQPIVRALLKLKERVPVNGITAQIHAFHASVLSRDSKETLLTSFECQLKILGAGTAVHPHPILQE